MSEGDEKRVKARDMGRVALALGHHCVPGDGCVMLLFSFGDGSHISCTCHAKREEIPGMLRALADSVEAGWPNVPPIPVTP